MRRAVNFLREHKQKAEELRKGSLSIKHGGLVRDPHTNTVRWNLIYSLLCVCVCVCVCVIYIYIYIYIYMYIDICIYIYACMNVCT
jgi:hypothetical protein